ncbi:MULTISPECIES: hypothetical protein [Bhargavaea]|uniref:Uncharacterized protein n=1 Tax=Bhargavaea changchunensis TaxID=2134037 RepID=A0ABW2NE37_9BACL|nr:hypothetical protein [Bhargavaea sp. CC-171006]
MTALAVLPVMLLLLFLILAFRWRYPVTEGRTVLRLFAGLIGLLAVLAIAAQFVRPSADSFPYVGEDAANELDDIYSKVIIEENPDAVPEDQIFSRITFGIVGDTLTIRAAEEADEMSFVQAVIRTGNGDEAALTIFRPKLIANGYDLTEALPLPEADISPDGQILTLGSPFLELTINQISEPDLPPFSKNDGYSSYHRLPIYLITVPEGTEVKTEGPIDLIEI